MKQAWSPELIPNLDNGAAKTSSTLLSLNFPLSLKYSKFKLTTEPIFYLMLIYVGSNRMISFNWISQPSMREENLLGIETDGTRSSPWFNCAAKSISQSWNINSKAEARESSSMKSLLSWTNCWESDSILLTLTSDLSSESIENKEEGKICLLYCWLKLTPLLSMTDVNE